MGNRVNTGRGRPRGFLHSRPDIKVLEYIDRLSAKYETSRSDLFNAIIYAWENKTATCGELTIDLRAKNKDHPIFLITRDQLVVAQFPIPWCILEETNPFSGFEFVSERFSLSSQFRRGRRHAHAEVI